ncbi:MAG: hypothetical protein ABFS42_04295 [Candidatus Krumholzibacteriota bacterium]
MKTTTRIFLFFPLFLAVSAIPAWADSPILTVWANPGYGTWVFDGSDPTPVVISFPAGDPLGIGFSWLGNADPYGGTIAGYRFGWDIMDPGDPNDPGWASADFGPWEFTAQKVFSDGLHSFTLVVKDTAGATTMASFIIDVQDPVGTISVSWGQLKAGFWK